MARGSLPMSIYAGLGPSVNLFGGSPKDLLGMSKSELYNLLLDYVFSGKLKVGYRMNNEINYCIF